MVTTANGAQFTEAQQAIGCDYLTPITSRVDRAHMFRGHTVIAKYSIFIQQLRFKLFEQRYDWSARRGLEGNRIHIARLAARARLAWLSFRDRVNNA